MPEDVVVELASGQATAKKAASILVANGTGFLIPTARQRQNLLVAFAKQGKVVYGKAFDVIKLTGSVDLDEPEKVEAQIANITVFEIKSTRKSLAPDFSGYFFALTAAEVLVAQSLKSQFRFALVNTVTGAHLEMTLAEIFARAKGIYPTWSVAF